MQQHGLREIAVRIEQGEPGAECQIRAIRFNSSVDLTVPVWPTM